jgi:hypothetical protein
MAMGVTTMAGKILLPSKSGLVLDSAWKLTSLSVLSLLVLGGCGTYTPLGANYIHPHTTAVAGPANRSLGGAQGQTHPHTWIAPGTVITYGPVVHGGPHR